MTWETGYYYLPQYEYVSCNQHGDRFKRKASKKFNVAKLSCEVNNAIDLKRLILISHTLNVPVHYDFEDHIAFIEVVSVDVLRNKI